MKSLLTKVQKEKEMEYLRYKKLIRNIRKANIEKINPKYITKK